MIPSITLPWITVERFGRINLIVGKNGTGKTRLLGDISHANQEPAMLHGITFLGFTDIVPSVFVEPGATSEFRWNGEPSYEMLGELVNRHRDGPMSFGQRRLAYLHKVAAGSAGKLVLIDGIEEGLHHSHARPLWEAILDSKAQQVFATTHSRDFVEALASVAAARNSDEACIIRLEPERRGNKAFVMAPDEVRMLAGTQVEVR